MKCRLFLAGMLLWAGSVSAGEVEPMLLRSFGQDNAALIYVFTSASCPHCAFFHDQIMPLLKKEFVQTGRAQIKVVDMPYDARAFQAMQLARCMDETVYARFMDQVYANQAVWGYGQNPETVLKAYAVDAGMSQEASDVCLADKALTARIKEQRDNLADLYRVRGMPTTVVVADGKSASFAGTETEEILDGIAKMLGAQK